MGGRGYLRAMGGAKALEEALTKGKPEAFNTDQGSQFASEGFIGLLGYLTPTEVSNQKSGSPLEQPHEWGVVLGEYRGKLQRRSGTCFRTRG